MIMIMIIILISVLYLFIYLLIDVCLFSMQSFVVNLPWYAIK